jgi:hypothetical protein
VSNEQLKNEAHAFASKLKSLLRNTVCSGVEIDVALSEQRYVVVAPGPIPKNKHLSRAGFFCVDKQARGNTYSNTPLWLRVFFIVEMDDENEYMAIGSSTFALCVNVDTGLCPVRVEYDRHKESKPQAHVQIHGSSSSLGYAFAISGQTIRELDTLHIPLGGRRFRPSVEDFIEFLVQERLISGLSQAGKKALEAGRQEWEQRQAMATARRFPDEAAAQLRRMGYHVEEPPERSVDD